MAATSDPRAAGFSASAFRDAITFVMNMGMPDDASEKATFQWKPVKDFAVADPAENPYDWTQSPVTSSTHADVIVPVAVEFTGNVSGITTGNAMGDFENPYTVITILDTYHDQIIGANVVLMGGNTYDVKYTEPPIGLFDVTVYRIHLQAADES